MKSRYILLFILLPFRLFAQQLNGIVIDKNTNIPVIYANVSTASLQAVTSYSGQFMLTAIHRGDTIRVTCIGYRPYKRVYNKAKSDTIIIYLQQSSILLRDVNVKARHDFKLDSINMRRQFSAIFNYKAPTFKDLFITTDPYVYIPYDYIK